MAIVLVTGAGGFLGSALVNVLLDAGVHVRALGQPHLASPYPGVLESVKGDIRDSICVKSVVTGCESVIHLAAKVHALDEDQTSEEEYRSVNVEGTRHLLEAATDAGVHKFIFASSVKVFGEETGGCVDEDAPPAPKTAYGRSKWMAEQLVSSHVRAGRMTTVSFRLPLVYGPTDKGNLFRMIVAIDRGWFPPLPRVPMVRSMLHVKNFISAVRAALATNQFRKPAYIVADAHPYEISSVYDRLREGLGKKPARVRVPWWALSAGARAGDVLERLWQKPVPLSTSTLSKLMSEAWYMRDMGYQPLHNFDGAVPELIEHYRRSLRRCGL